MSPEAELFLKFDYPVTKDLCKDFLTLVSAILVFSLAFSEKIADFPRASPLTKRYLLSAWVCFVSAIIMCGAGLAAVTLASGMVVYGDSGWLTRVFSSNYLSWANTGWSLIMGSGALFVGGLVWLVLGAIRSIDERRAMN